MRGVLDGRQSAHFRNETGVKATGIKCNGEQMLCTVALHYFCCRNVSHRSAAYREPILLMASSDNEPLYRHHHNHHRGLLPGQWLHREMMQVNINTCHAESCSLGLLAAHGASCEALLAYMPAYKCFVIYASCAPA